MKIDTLVNALSCRQGLFAARIRFALFTLLSLCVLGCASKNPEEILQEAANLYKSRDIEGAEIKYEEFLDRYPDSELAPQAHMGLAVCYFGQQQFERCREELNRTVQAAGGPQTPMGFQAAGLRIETHKAEKNFEAALADGLKTSDSLRNAPDEARQMLQMKISELYLANDQEESAMEIFRYWLEDGPSIEKYDRPVLDGMVRIYVKRNELDNAIGVYQDYLKRYPDCSFKGAILFGIGVFGKQMGQEKEATAAFDASEAEYQHRIERAPGADEKADLLLQLSRLRSVRGDNQGSREALLTVVDNYPLSQFRPHAMMFLTENALADNQFDQALMYLEQITKEYPNERMAYQAAMQIQQIKNMMAQEQATTGTLTLDGASTGALAIDGSSTAVESLGQDSNQPTTGEANSQ